MSSSVSSGYSAMISPQLPYVDTKPSTSPTVKRIPRTQGLPLRLLGSTLMI